MPKKNTTAHRHASTPPAIAQDVRFNIERDGQTVEVEARIEVDPRMARHIDEAASQRIAERIVRHAWADPFLQDVRTMEGCSFRVSALPTAVPPRPAVELKRGPIAASVNVTPTTPEKQEAARRKVNAILRSLVSG